MTTKSWAKSQISIISCIKNTAQKMMQVRPRDMHRKSVVNTLGVNCKKTRRKDDIYVREVTTNSHDLSVWTIVYVFFYNFNLIAYHILPIYLENLFRRVKIQQNLRNEENNRGIVQGKRAITSLSLAYEISTGH